MRKRLAKALKLESSVFKDFERKGNRWLELCKNFILTANQAQIAALRGNFSEKKNYLEKDWLEPAPAGAAGFCRIQKPLEIA